MKVKKCVEISTAHLGSFEREWLTENLSGAGFSTVLVYDEGYMFRIYEDMTASIAQMVGVNDVPAQIKKLLSWAYDQGIEWLEVDCDAPICDGLEVFEDVVM